MIQYVYQNFLLLMNLVINRLNYEKKSKNLKEIFDIVNSKKGSIQKKNEIFMNLKRNNE